jgi:hypothetical protein
MKTAAVIMSLLTACVVGCASDNVYIGHNEFIRPNTPIAVLEGGQNGVPLGTLNSGEYFWINLYPGIHQFTGMFSYAGDYRGNGISTQPFQLEPGKTYYFQVIQKPAHAIQDIEILERDDFSDMSSYKSPQSQPVQKSNMALAYFFYKIPDSDIAAIRNNAH